MKIFVSRHQGAIDWLGIKGIEVDHYISHLDLAVIQAGDVVIGTLPVHLIAGICERGAQYFHLQLEMPENLRGKELTREELHSLNATLIGYEARRVPGEIDQIVD